ncbi:MAG: aminotransferase class V-fold PLP-dependent enzyme [Anaerolineae bacterium]
MGHTHWGRFRSILRALDPDFYTGNLHKWVCAPKGSAFLYVRRSQQAIIELNIVSWGCMMRWFVHRQNQKQGTREPAAYLSVPAAIQFQREHHWDEVRASRHTLIESLHGTMAELFDLPPIAPSNGSVKCLPRRCPFVTRLPSRCGYTINTGSKRR